MVKLKYLLKEAADTNKFEQLVEDERILIPTTLLYRGLSKSVDTFKKIPIRQDRKSLNTSAVMDSLVEAARQHYNPTLPSRRRSTFVTSSEHYASKYGQVHYVFFRKSANVAWWPHDTYPAYLRGGPRKFDESHKGNEIMNEYRDEYKHAFTFLDLWDDEKIGSLERYMVKYFESTLVELHKFYKVLKDRLDDEMVKGGLFTRPHAKQLLDITSTMLGMKDSLGSLKSYVDDANRFNPNSTKRMADVVVEDDWILVVNRQWFDSNFELKQGRINRVG